MNKRTKAEDKAAGYSVAMILTLIVTGSIGDFWPESRAIYGAAMFGLVIGGLIMSALLTQYFKRFPDLNAQAGPIFETNERVIQVERNALLILVGFVIAAVFVLWISDSTTAAAVISIAGFVSWLSYGVVFTKKACREANS